MCTLNPNFPEFDRLKSIMKSHKSLLLKPFDKVGLRVYELNVHASASFRLQSCRFIRGSILKPSQDYAGSIRIWDSFHSDLSCDFASPLIINKRDGGIRMAVDYRDVNMQPESTMNQLPYQPTLFQRLRGETFLF